MTKRDRTFVHGLNGSSMDQFRTFIAILEILKFNPFNKGINEALKFLQRDKLNSKRTQTLDLIMTETITKQKQNFTRDFFRMLRCLLNTGKGRKLVFLQ